MGVYLGQLPPAELARLKAELAETLIAHFCYPRFYDYRTESLRTRPVDRSKRQEVWLYLSSVDFTAWNRVDLMSPDFQYHIERLFIHFVQRNRNFFGEQGRKRMSDIRMLIGASAASVVQGLLGHLSGKAQRNPPFGSPRPVSSWSTTNVTARFDASWEQVAAPTWLLQQQVQESRGEIKPVSPPQAQGEVRLVTTNVRRSNLVQPPTTGNITNGNGNSIERTSVAQVPVNTSTPPHVNGRSTTSQPQPVHNYIPPAHSGWNANTAPSLSTPKLDPDITPVETPIVSVASTAVPAKKPAGSVVPPPPLSTPEQSRAPVPSVSAAVVQQHVPQQPAPIVATTARAKPTVLIGEEDMAVFEQLRHQLIVWLRIEAIHAGLDISNQGPSQLLELLRQHGSFDETRLQVVSTLLSLSNQVIKNGQASLFDYKQALMLHLVHTRR